MLLRSTSFEKPPAGMSVIAPRTAARPTHASRAVLQLSLPFWTKWGQTVVVLGSWDEERKKGQPLACRHTGENELLWETRVSVPLACGHVSYRYAIVNEACEIEVEEGGARIVALPQDLRDTSVIELQDNWQVLDHSVRVPCANTLPCRMHLRLDCQVAAETHAVQPYTLQASVSPSWCWATIQVRPKSLFAPSFIIEPQARQKHGLTSVCTGHIQPCFPALEKRVQGQHPGGQEPGEQRPCRADGMC